MSDTYKAGKNKLKFTEPKTRPIYIGVQDLYNRRITVDFVRDNPPSLHVQRNKDSRDPHYNNYVTTKYQTLPLDWHSWSTRDMVNKGFNHSVIPVS